MLPNDMCRCDGESSITGRTCDYRESCCRYLAPVGMTSPVAAMLCHPMQPKAMYIPVEDVTIKR